MAETRLRPIRVAATLPYAPEAVWAVVSDSRRDPEWCPLVPSVTQTTGDGPGPGATYDFQQQLPDGRIVDGTIKVIGYYAPDHIAWDVEDAVRHYFITMSLRPTRRGHTRITQESHPTFKRDLGARRILVPLLTKRALKRQYRALARLLATETQ